MCHPVMRGHDICTEQNSPVIPHLKRGSVNQNIAVQNKLTFLADMSVRGGGGKALIRQENLSFYYGVNNCLEFSDFSR